MRIPFLLCKKYTQSLIKHNTYKNNKQHEEEIYLLLKEINRLNNQVVRLKQHVFGEESFK